MVNNNGNSGNPVKCQTKDDTYIMEYMPAVEAAKAQRSIFWPPEEPRIEKDVQQLMVDMTEAERHGVLSVLKLFTLREMVIGSEYWGGRFKRMFPRPDFQTMASAFSFMEVNVHAIFYNRINELLGLDTPEFHNSYKEHPKMVEAMDFLDEACSDNDDLYSLAIFSMIEGAVLYSSFAFLMHFQLGSKNIIPNICAGIGFSVKDELLHSDGGAWAFSQLLKEKQDAGYISELDLLNLENRIRDVCEKILDHEYHLIEMIFEKGPIDGITKVQLRNFIQHRINDCMNKLGFKKVYRVTYNPIAKPFYKAIKNDVQHDFFHTVGSSYNRDWSESEFEFPEELINAG